MRQAKRKCLWANVVRAPEAPGVAIGARCRPHHHDGGPLLKGAFTLRKSKR